MNTLVVAFEILIFIVNNVARCLKCFVLTQFAVYNDEFVQCM